MNLPPDPCPFCAHDKPVLVTIERAPPIYLVACPECGATGPKTEPGNLPKYAVFAWNLRYGA